MVYMSRNIDNKIRYYNIELQKNLFEEFMVINTYGSINNRSPTGKIVNYFKSKVEAGEFVKNEVIRKQKNRYKIIKDL